MKATLPKCADFSYIFVGCSAGGVDALLETLPGLPADSRASVVVVIHLLEGQRSLLSELFSARCRLPAKEAEDKEAIAPGTIYFAPAGYHLLLERDRSFSLTVEEPVNYSRPSIDVFFESAALAGGPDALGILLTGANQDGAAGLKAIANRGGITIVQDPEEATHATMPRSALDLFEPHAVWSLRRIREYFSGDVNGTN